MAVICPTCKRTNNEADARCVVCGAELAAGVSPAGGAAVAVAAPPAAGSAAAAAPAATSAVASAGSPAAGEEREKLIWSGRASYKDMLGPWIAWGIVAVALLVLSLIFLRDGRDGFLGFFVVAARWISLAIVVVSAIWLLWRTVSTRWAVGYRLTEERLFIDRGLLARVTDQTELIRVDDVRVRQSAIQRLFNLGDVIVISTDATDRQVVVGGILDPNGVAEHIRTHMRRLRKKGLYVESL
jgi:membrane protein YdbS with pleckstrin-like domain